jgi:hypothetical protein
LLHQPGIVQHHIDAPESLDSRIDQSFYLCAISDVRGLGERFGAIALKLVGQSLDALHAARPQHDDGATGREIACRGGAEPAAGARDDGNFAFDWIAHNDTPAC